MLLSVKISVYIYSILYIDIQYVTVKMISEWNRPVTSVKGGFKSMWRVLQISFKEEGIIGKTANNNVVFQTLWSNIMKSYKNVHKKAHKVSLFFDTDYSKLLEFTHETNKFPFCDNKDEFSWINVGQIWNGQYKLTHNTQVMAFSFYSVIEEALYALHFTQVNTSY